jgi:4-diphosphocytidyl-2-C-methyl-D-erythritol kinase
VLTILARAKINLGLEVVRRRDDGYHDIVTIFQEIDVSDTLHFDASSDLSVECRDSRLATDANLVLQAARLLQDTFGTSRGARIEIFKQIPVAAGLGGGSSDAAATLVGLNSLWGLDLPPKALAPLARRLGADVTFFLHGGTQLGMGRGDDLSHLPTPEVWVVLTMLPVRLPDKTRRLYQALNTNDLTDGHKVLAFAEAIRCRGRLPIDRLVNTFERPAVSLFPEIGLAHDAVRQAGGRPLLGGAGPTVLSVHEDEETARDVARRLHTAGRVALVARSVARV